MFNKKQDIKYLRVPPHKILDYKEQKSNFTAEKSCRHPLIKRSKLISRYQTNQNHMLLDRVK